MDVDGAGSIAAVDVEDAAEAAGGRGGAGNSAAVVDGGDAAMVAGDVCPPPAPSQQLWGLRGPRVTL